MEEKKQEQQYYVDVITAALERTIKRLWITILILAALIAATTAAIGAVTPVTAARKSTSSSLWRLWKPHQTKKRNKALSVCLILWTNAKRGRGLYRVLFFKIIMNKLIQNVRNRTVLFDGKNFNLFKKTFINHGRKFYFFHFSPPLRNLFIYITQVRLDVKCELCYNTYIRKIME